MVFLDRTTPIFFHVRNAVCRGDFFQPDVLKRGAGTQCICEIVEVCLLKVDVSAFHTCIFSFRPNALCQRSGLKQHFVGEKQHARNMQRGKSIVDLRVLLIYCCIGVEESHISPSYTCLTVKRDTVTRAVSGLWTKLEVLRRSLNPYVRGMRVLSQLLLLSLSCATAVARGVTLLQGGKERAGVVTWVKCS